MPTRQRALSLPTTKDLYWNCTSSLPGTTAHDAKRLNRVIRTHWESENRVHGVWDVAMGEDANRTRKGESAQNLALMRKLALHLLRQEPSVPVGIAAKQKRARGRPRLLAQNSVTNLMRLPWMKNVRDHMGTIRVTRG